MTARLEMPSALPADYAEMASDVMDYMTPAEEAERDAEVDRKVKELLCSEAWWDLVLCGISQTTNALPAILARVMANLDNACSGDQIGRDAVTTAMSQLQRLAKGMARKEVED